MLPITTPSRVPNQWILYCTPRVEDAWFKHHVEEKTKLWVQGERMLALTPDEPPDTFNFLPELQKAKQSHLYEALKMKYAVFWTSDLSFHVKTLSVSAEHYIMRQSGGSVSVCGLLSLNQSAVNVSQTAARKSQSYVSCLDPLSFRRGGPESVCVCLRFLNDFSRLQSTSTWIFQPQIQTWRKQTARNHWERDTTAAHNQSSVPPNDLHTTCM